MENTKEFDFNSALNELEKISKTFTVDVWIPSLKKNIKFKQIDAKQQKDILSSAMDTSVYNTSFVKTFYEIIKYNILPESNINLDEFTLVDKISIGLTLKEQITDELMLFFGEDKKEITQKFKIKPILDKLKQYETPSSIILNTKNDNFELEVEISPVTIGAEYLYETQYRGNKKKEDIKTSEDVQQLISEAFIGELSKYISNMWINKSEINFKILTLNQKIRLIEKLPSSFLQKILDNISNWKSKTDEFLTIKHENYEQVISLDASMFLS
jgi:hypothetical protein